MSEPIVAYYWPTPNGKKVTIALEEMGLAYRVEPVDIGAGDQFTPEYLAISPNNRMPTIVDPEGPDGKPLAIFESGAILQYLGRKSGRFYPTGERERADVEQWLYWQVGGLGPMAGQFHHFHNYAPKLEPDPSKLAYGAHRYECEVNRLYGVLERGLSDGRDFIAGAFSIADMAIYPWILPERHNQTIADFPRLQAWRERVGAREGVRRGMAVKTPKGLILADEGPEAERARAILFGQRATPSQ